MAEKSVDVPTPWWCEYQSAFLGPRGFAIGWLKEGEDFKGDLQLMSLYAGIPEKGVQPVFMRSVVIKRSDIIREGPCAMGVRMTREEYEKMKAAEAAAAAYNTANPPDTPYTHSVGTDTPTMPPEQQRGFSAPLDAEATETRPDHDWGV